MRERRILSFLDRFIVGLSTYANTFGRHKMIRRQFYAETSEKNALRPRSVRQQSARSFVVQSRDDLFVSVHSQYVDESLDYLYIADRRFSSYLPLETC